MYRNRLIPILLLQGKSLVKTVKFNDFVYIGDPCNTVRIFNELEVDELIFLDIKASLNSQEINYEVLKEISDECFMPLGYGGGIKNLDDAKKIFDIGFEKISLNTSVHNDEELLHQISSIYGSQAIVVSIDVRYNFFGKPQVFTCGGTKNTKLDPVQLAKKVESLGAGEILLTSIDREGTWEGLDLKLITDVVQSVNIPVIANGGVGNLEHIDQALESCPLSAVGTGSMVVFQKKGMGVLVNFPKIEEKYIHH